ncbi:MAG TPA: hypothetical protein PK340_02965 [Bacilli bacterium]|jgi:hypothetical protein|nr:hypothetical protein [Bacilli bacterium]
MSELKGQLLGVLLVLTLFGTMSMMFVSVFQSATNHISQQVADQITPP